MQRSAVSDYPALAAIVALTAVSWLLAELLRAQATVAVLAGFVPATVLHAVAPPAGMAMLPVWITPLTATLVHGGGLHLGLNLVMLALCGRVLERAIGGAALVVLYVAGAYGAAAAQWAIAPDALVPTIGASGAISALVGAYALLFSEQRVPRIGPIPPRAVRVAWLLAAWVGIQLLVGIATSAGGPQIAIGAHIGGFIVGLALARPLLLWRYRGA